MRRRFGLLLAILLGCGVVYAQDTDTPTPDPGTITEPFTNRPLPSTTSIDIGETVQGVLSTETPSLVYLVALQAGQTYRINVGSADFDTYVLVLDENERPLIDDDDGGEDSNSRIAAFSPAEDGVYRVQVSSFAFVATEAASGGNFTLRVDAVRTENLAANTPTSGELAAGDTRIYAFEGEAGEIIAISASSDQFDTVLTLSQGGTELAADDDSGEGTNSILGPIALPDDGTYVVGLRGYSPEIGGAYELALGRADEAVMDYGDQLTVNGVAGIPEVITLDAFTGDLVEVRLSGTDTAFFVSSPNGSPVTEGVTRATGQTTRPQSILFEALETGQYTLILMPIRSGLVDLSMILGRYVPVDETGPLVPMNQDGQGFALFEVTEEERVTVTLIPQDNPRWELDVNVVQNDNVIAGYSGFGGEALTFTITFETAGEVRLRLRDFAFTDGYEVQVVRSAQEAKD